MIAARSVEGDRARHDLGGSSSGGATATTRSERRGRGVAGSTVGASVGSRAGQAGATRDRGSRWNRPIRAERAGRQRQPGVAVARGTGAAARGAPPPGRCPRRRARRVEDRRSRQQRPTLDEDELRGDGHERADVAEAVVLERRERLEVRPGEVTERHGQDVELALLDEGEQQRERAVELGHLGPWWRASGRRPSPNRTAGPAGPGPATAPGPP